MLMFLSKNVFHGFCSKGSDSKLLYTDNNIALSFAVFLSNKSFVMQCPFILNFQCVVFFLLPLSTLAQMGWMGLYCQWQKVALQSHGQFAEQFLQFLLNIKELFDTSQFSNILQQCNMEREDRTIPGNFPEMIVIHWTYWEEKKLRSFNQTKSI